MSTQIIDFNNVENIVFNGNQVESLKLNNNVIWEGFKKLEQLMERSIVSVSAEDLGDITSIGAGAFNSCTRLTSITIPSSVTSIGDSAFGSCTSLTSITIPSSVTNIGSGAFAECSNLTTMKVLPTTPPTLANALSISSATTRIEVPSNSLETYKEATIWSTFANRMVGV